MNNIEVTERLLSYEGMPMMQIRVNEKGSDKVKIVNYVIGEDDESLGRKKLYTDLAIWALKRGDKRS